MQKCRLIELSLNSSHVSLHWLLRLLLFSTYLEGGNCEYSQNVEHLDLILDVLPRQFAFRAIPECRAVRVLMSVLFRLQAVGQFLR